MGVDDVQYKGNTFVMEWKGCPDAVLARLGVHYGRVVGRESWVVGHGLGRGHAGPATHDP
jgi:hypothetical protein